MGADRRARRAASAKSISIRAAINSNPTRRMVRVPAPSSPLGERLFGKMTGAVEPATIAHAISVLGVCFIRIALP
jgi:hypothetical protein